MYNKLILSLLLAVSPLSAVYGSSIGDPPYEELTEEEKRMAAEPDFCVRLAQNYDPKVISLARPFIEEFLNPATVDGYGHPLESENFDVGTIILDATTLALDRENEGVFQILKPVFDSDVSPRLKAETARLVTTLPLGDQGGFVDLWKGFYEEHSHPDVHERIVQNVIEAEGMGEDEGPVKSLRTLNGPEIFSHDFEGHKFDHARACTPSENIPLMSLVRTACPLEIFLKGLSEVLFLYPEDQRLEKSKLVLAQYPAISRPIDVLEYVMKEGSIDKEMYRLITFLSLHGKAEWELESALPSVVWWLAGVSPTITLKDLHELERKVREVLEANDGVVTFDEFHDFLKAPYVKWDAEHKK